MFLCPEKLVRDEDFIPMLDELYKQNAIDRFVVDEVHCMSQWGQDFRKDYQELKMLKTKYKTVPILALTATATIKVKDDVCHRLRMHDLQCFQSSFNRPNLYYEVRKKKTLQHMEKDMLKLITDRF